MADVTEYPSGKRCPCGSGRRYRTCCKKKRFRWMVDEDGSVWKEIPLHREALDAFYQMSDEFKATFGREPRGDDLIFPLAYMYSEAEFHQQAISAMHEAGIRPELIYAYSKTKRIVTEQNKDLLSDVELEEWDAAIDEYAEQQTEDEDREFGAALTDLLQEWNALLIMLGVVISKVLKENEAAEENDLVSRTNLVLYLCTVRTYRSMKSVLILLQQDAGEDILSLARTMYENYLAINYVIADPSRSYELIDRSIGLATGSFAYRKTKSGAIDRSQIIEKATGNVYRRRGTFYEMAAASPHSVDVELFDALYEYLSGFAHPDINAFDIFSDTADQFGREPIRLLEASVVAYSVVAMVADAVQRWRFCNCEVRQDINFITARVAKRIGALVERSGLDGGLKVYRLLRGRLEAMPTPPE